MREYQFIKNRLISSLDDMIEDFYKPAMSNAKIYKRMAGYFSSNLIDILYEELKYTDVFNNIKIQIICSPELSFDDKVNIAKGMAYKEIIEKSIIKDIKNFNIDNESLPLITKLIVKGIIDIKFVVNREGNGIFHAKEGVFVDHDNYKIAFTGSNNETFSAIKYNFETTTVFQEIEYPNIVEEIDALFNSIWEDKNSELKQIKITDNIKKEFIKLDEKISKNRDNNNENDFSVFRRLKLFPYQEEALDNWKRNNHIGLLEMATGTGKTITALAGYETLMKSKERLLTVVVVPQIDLVSQWAEEFIQFGGKPIECNSEKKRWKEKLKLNINNLKRGVIENVFVITTIETFKSKEFQSVLYNYRIKDSLIIVDEVHSFGAKQIRDLYDKLNGVFNYRLGVSATPFRKDDNESNQLIEFFSKIIFSYSLEDAIHNGYLNNYEYYPILLNFSDNELINYRNEINKKDNGRFDAINLNEIERLTSSIANASSAKVYKLIELIGQHGKTNPKIVYCSPGLFNDGLFKKDIKHIEYVQRELGNLGCKLRVVKSGVKLKEREEILKQFKTRELDTLLAIKCLDQGVNLKSVTHAYILSSTDTLTEFIQRRGRILRIEEGKPISKIYDLVMLPQDISDYNILPSQEDAYLVDRELRRMKEYNLASNNKSENKLIINEIENVYKEVLNEYHEKRKNSN